MKLILIILFILIPILCYAQQDCIKPMPNCDVRYGILAGTNVSLPVSWYYIYPMADDFKSYINNTPAMGFNVGAYYRFLKKREIELLVQGGYVYTRIKSEARLGYYVEKYTLTRQQLRLPVILQTTLPNNKRLKIGIGVFAAYELNYSVNGTQELLAGALRLGRDGELEYSTYEHREMTELMNLYTLPEFYVDPLLQVQYCLKSKNRCSLKLFSQISYAYNPDIKLKNKYPWNSYQIITGLNFGFYKQ